MTECDPIKYSQQALADRTFLNVLTLRSLRSSIHAENETKGFVNTLAQLQLARVESTCVSISLHAS